MVNNNSQNKFRSYVEKIFKKYEKTKNISAINKFTDTIKKCSKAGLSLEETIDHLQDNVNTIEEKKIKKIKLETIPENNENNNSKFRKVSRTKKYKLQPNISSIFNSISLFSRPTYISKHRSSRRRSSSRRS